VVKAKGMGWEEKEESKRIEIETIIILALHK